MWRAVAPTRELLAQLAHDGLLGRQRDERALDGDAQIVAAGVGRADLLHVGDERVEVALGLPDLEQRARVAARHVRGDHEAPRIVVCGVPPSADPPSGRPFS